MKLSKDILNSGLNFSMEFGKNWLVEINARLSKVYPELTKSELNTCAELCKKVNEIANDFVYKNPVKTGKKIKFIDFSEFKNFVKTEYDWIDDKNLHRLYSQSCYYAWK